MTPPRLSLSPLFPSPPHCISLDLRDPGERYWNWTLCFFPGFYYVCVDFNPAATASANAACDVVEEEQRNGRKQQRTRRGSSTHRISTAKRPPSPAPYTAPVATMSGFYYHQNSEPCVLFSDPGLLFTHSTYKISYQQLSLTHAPEISSSSFEFRWGALLKSWNLFSRLLTSCCLFFVPCTYYLLLGFHRTITRQLSISAPMEWLQVFDLVSIIFLHRLLVVVAACSVLCLLFSPVLGGGRWI